MRSWSGRSPTGSSSTTCAATAHAGDQITSNRSPTWRTSGAAREHSAAPSGATCSAETTCTCTRTAVATVESVSERRNGGDGRGLHTPIKRIRGTMVDNQHSGSASASTLPTRGTEEPRSQMQRDRTPPAPPRDNRTSTPGIFRRGSKFVVRVRTRDGRQLAREPRHCRRLAPSRPS